MTLLVRPRRYDDVPTLVALLAEQQASSRYPLRWPLPFPAEEFLVRDGEQRAWVAELDGQVVGHVVASLPGADTAEGFHRAAGRTDVVEVSVLFTSLAARGTGVGGRLLDTAVDWIRDQGRLPVLDVVLTHGAAVEVYRHRGWVEIGRVHPEWLPTWMPGGLPEVLLMMLPDPAESAN